MHRHALGIIAFLEAKIQASNLVWLHLFVEAVLSYLNVAAFQLNLNTHRSIVAFFVLHGEAWLGEPIIEEFSYFYYIKLASGKMGFR